VHHLPGGTRLSGRIVEVEAYRPDDSASHSFRGPTARNAPMFGAPGLAYVYLIYGLHNCVNVSTEAVGISAAVLIRALEPIDGIQIMQQRRGIQTVSKLCRGPGNVCKALGIDRSLIGLDLTRRGSVLAIADDCLRPDQIGTSERVGVRGDAAAREAPWRFFIAGNGCVSDK